MRKSDHSYNWAQALLNVASCPATDLPTLIKEAGLDPIAGDIADIDLSSLDLSGQDLTGWDLSYANWNGTKVVQTKLRGAKIDFKEIIKAQKWETADLDHGVFSQAELLQYEEFLRQPIEERTVMPRTVFEVLNYEEIQGTILEDPMVIRAVRKAIELTPPMTDFLPLIQFILSKNANSFKYGALKKAARQAVVTREKNFRRRRVSIFRTYLPRVNLPRAQKSGLVTLHVQEELPLVRKKKLPSE